MALESDGYRVFPWQIDSSNPWWSRPLKLGEIGCTLSQLACWTAAVRRPEPYTLILEDDAILCNDFTRRLLACLGDLAGRFDLLYLGRFPLESDLPYLPGIVSPGYSHCTFGYLLTRIAIEELLALRIERCHRTHRRDPSGSLHRPPARRPTCPLPTRYPRRLTTLACDPPLVRQLPKDEAGSDTEDSPFIDE
ncbi:MAG: glycosyltransferase family 25 protein [Streptomycetales bacterium]